ncbi:hypothetical protein DL89DRAFT_266694 [Linderina pennispora]|uniref:Uncharacterized protein n=1 Tax=Linderina pennispora TaxID=61395 RepID=A0A1Y1WB63_9FUNG|nr:uncharacterized protein DL89DRAFT_266694 [Linderina pennispora]ORX70486.1 hypothetical protein DL89DRAFT_266694 [Linderina pennispora]
MVLTPLYQAYKSLIWADQALWGATSAPDAFGHLLALSTLKQTLDISKLPATPERTTLERAWNQAVKDHTYAVGLANLCGTYYFLRRLTPFNLDACLGQLEPVYPGIQLFVNFARFETNIMQECGLGLEPFDTLRRALPQDGELYFNTLQCIVGCLQKNAGITQMLSETRKLFGPAASSLVWEINDAAAAAYAQQFDDDEFADDEFGAVDDDSARSIAESFHTAEMPVGVVQ